MLAANTLFLRLSFVILLLISTQAKAQDEHVFYGNSSIPPMLYLENGQSMGMVHQIFDEIAKRIESTTVKLQLENWKVAQELVRNGEASGLVQLNKNADREKYLVFSDPLIVSEFVIFHKYNRNDIFSVADLSGKKVAVEPAGYPVSLLRKYPDIEKVTVSSWSQGFKDIRDGKVDALVVDRWVGEFVLAQEKISDIAIAPQPIETLASHIAVRTELAPLVTEINQALRDMKADGSFDNILKRWSGERVVYISERELDLQAKNETVMYAAIAFGLTALALLVAVIIREKKVRRLNRNLENLVVKRTEQLQTQRDSLDEIIWGTNTGTWQWHIKNGEMVLNDRWAEIIGYGLEELGQTTIETWTEKTHPDDGEKARDLLRKHFDGKSEYFDNECRMRHKDGHWVWVHARGKVVEWGDDGKALRMSGTQTEITQRKKLQYDLILARQEAIQASEAKSIFLSNMSHEIRTPMMGIRGALELLKDSEVNDDNMELLSDLDQASASLMTLLDDVLDLSKIEAGRLNLNFEPGEPAQIVSHVVNVFNLKASAKGLILSTNAAKFKGYFCKIEDLRFKQIVGNLINNAIKFTHQGKIDVLMDIVKGSTTDTLIVAIKDTGIGMSDLELAKVFRRFNQASSGTAKAYGGSGLGLTISSELAKLLGASISVESTQGQGSVFTISMPVEPAAAVVKETSDHQVPKLNIMLAEDNPINQRITSAMLTKDGHDVVIAEDGQQAIDRAETGVFDLILMDMHMPNVDGMEATQAIRETSKFNRNTPIIAFTADALASNKVKFLESGVNDIATKPIRYDTLKAIITRVIFEDQPHPPQERRA